MTRLVNTLLLLAIVGGLVLFGSRQFTLAKLKSEHSRLASRFGQLDVQHPDRYLITRIETGDPMHFAWRCYSPAGLKIEERSGVGRIRGGGTSSLSGASEHIQRCRFRLEGDRLAIHRKNRGGGGLRVNTERELTAFLKEHWGDLEITQLASEGVVELGTDQVIPFLTIRIPDRLHEKFRSNSRSHFADSILEHGFYRIRHGTPAALVSFDQAEAAKSAEGRHE